MDVIEHAALLLEQLVDPSRSGECRPHLSIWTRDDRQCSLSE